MSELDARIAARTAELTAANDTAVQTGKLALLGQMAASISHEISQPLAALRTLADNAVAFLARDDTASARDNLRIIGELCTRMGHIVGELQGLCTQGARPPADGILQQVMAGALMLVEPLRHASGNTHRHRHPGFPGLGRPDPAFEQVLVNLLRNAMDAMETQPDRLIELRLQATETHVNITVRDHGPGLSADAQAHLFEPFFTNQAQRQGLGLGLSLSHAIVHEMGPHPCGTMHTPEPASHSACRAHQSPTPTHHRHHERIAD